MNKRISGTSLLIALLTLMALPQGLQAAQWTATQGDVVGIELPVEGKQIKVRAFGKAWPWKRLDEHRIKAWIGVDLGEKAGDHSISVRSSAGELTRTLRIQAGDFRISRIEVAKKMAEFDAATLKRIRADQAAIKQTYGMQVDADPDIAIAAQPTQGIVSTPFGAQRYVNGEARSPHSGIDIAAAEGTPVVNPLPGRVLLAQSMYLNGNTVVIGHGNGLVMVYSHLHSLKVKQSDWLDAGSPIGEVGMTGRATGPHLHWGVRFNQARINPDSLLAGRASP